MIDDNYDYNIGSEDHIWRKVGIFAAFGLGAYVAYRIYQNPESAKQLGRKVRSGLESAKGKASELAHVAREKASQWTGKVRNRGHKESVSDMSDDFEDVAGNSFSPQHPVGSQPVM